MEETKLNLTQKLAKIRAIADVVKKNKKGYGYTYADISEILAKVKAGMAKYNVSLVPEILHGTSTVQLTTFSNTKVDKAGSPYENVTTEYLVQGDMVFHWKDDETGDHEDVPWVIIGAQSDPSQAFGSGLTYCTRYFLTEYFQIPQVDSDVDAYRSKQKEAAESEDKAIATSIIEDLDVKIKAYLADHPDQSDEIKAFIGRYAKNSNYLAIKEPVLAKKLVTDFDAKYITTSKEV